MIRYVRVCVIWCVNYSLFTYCDLPISGVEIEFVLSLRCLDCPLSNVSCQVVGKGAKWSTYKQNRYEFKRVY